MGDSDEEFDRRRNRDKFRRERNDYDRGGRRDGWDNRMRDDWARRGPPMSRYDERRRFSPPRHDMSPPPHMKRMRRDWDESGYGGPDHWDGGQKMQEPDYPTQPVMQTFKQFLQSQDDSISDDDAVRKYAEYKQEFKKQQISEFFLAHKDEEWFKAKYHPDECDKRKTEQRAAVTRRCDVFIELMNTGWLDNLELDCEKQKDIAKILDAAVILMEGGTDFDLAVLDQIELDIKESRSEPKIEMKERVQEIKQVENKKKRKLSGDDDDSNSGISSNSLSDSEGEEKAVKPNTPNEVSKMDNSIEDNNMSPSKEENDETNKKEEEEEEEEEPEPAEPDEIKEIESPSEQPEEEKEKGAEDENDREKETEEKQEEEKPEKDEEKSKHPRALHKTLSIFLRNLAPAITKQEVESMCKRYPGFMRVAIQDPQPERRFHRRGWVTFDRSVNIKDICWNLNNIRLRDCDMGAIVNRDLKQRVRPVNGIVSHKEIARMDIRHAARVIVALDNRSDLWKESNHEENKTQPSAELDLGLKSKNPLLKNITDYMVEEADCEEQELLGAAGDNEDKKEGGCTKVETDDELNKVLDKLILYLRIVHSFDFYSVGEYPNEDEMPHRCGIIHARGSAPINLNAHAFNTAVTEWIHNFEQKMTPWVDLKTKLNEDDAEKLGRKSEDAEVEKFIEANTQEITKDKWLCPLSGKKFKGPDYVRKHITNKHEDRVLEVKKEVSYFNNYLADPKRPQLPEHPSRSATTMHTRTSEYHHPPHSYGRGPPGYGAPRERARGGYGYPPPPRDYRDRRMPPPPPHRLMGRGRIDPRPMVDYHDLDAPTDMDLL